MLRSMEWRSRTSSSQLSASSMNVTMRKTQGSKKDHLLNFTAKRGNPAYLQSMQSYLFITRRKSQRR